MFALPRRAREAGTPAASLGPRFPLALPATWCSPPSESPSETPCFWSLPCNSVALLWNRDRGFSGAHLARSPHPRRVWYRALFTGGAQAISEAWINEFQINPESGIPGRAWAEGLRVLREVSQGLRYYLVCQMKHRMFQLNFNFRYTINEKTHFVFLV